MEFGLYRILEFATLLSSTKTLLVSIMHSRYIFFLSLSKILSVCPF